MESRRMDQAPCRLTNLQPRSEDSGARRLQGRRAGRTAASPCASLPAAPRCLLIALLALPTVPPSLANELCAPLACFPHRPRSSSACSFSLFRKAGMHPHRCSLVIVFSSRSTTQIALLCSFRALMKDRSNSIARAPTHDRESTLILASVNILDLRRAPARRAPASHSNLDQTSIDDSATGRRAN